MKWYKAALQGGAQRYMDVTSQERAYNAEMALKAKEIAEAAKASNKKNTKKFGNLTFTWTDPNDILGGEWQQKKTRLDDFEVFLKNNFWTDGDFDSRKWDAFRTEHETGSDAIKNEWKSGLEAWLYPRDVDISDPSKGHKFNEYDYEWIKNWEDMYQVATDYDKPRKPDSITGVTMIQSGPNKGKNVEDLFDVIPNLQKTTAPNEVIVRPDDKIHLNVNDKNSMINVMAPVLMNNQYGGFKFKDKNHYYTVMDNQPHYLFTANALWNFQNDVKGWEKHKTFEEISQIAIYYNKTHDEMLDAMHLMAKKFTVGGNMEGTTQRTVLPNRQITGSEQSKAMAAMDANTRLQKIGDRLLKAYETVGMSGLSLNLFNLSEGLFGKTGQLNQLQNLLGYYDEAKKNKMILSEEGEGDFRGRIQNAINTFGEIDAGMEKISQAAAIEYLTVTLAFNLAMAEQGGGGGRAISDQDFEKALSRVGEDTWGSLDQAKSKLKTLMNISSDDYMIAKIRGNSKYSKTHDTLAEWWKSYNESFKVIKNEYVHQLKGNYYFSEIKDTETGEIKDYYLEDKEGGGFNKINYYYNGRLASLMAYDFGERPDIDIRDREAQGIWSTMTDGEKAIIRPNKSALELLDGAILGSHGYKSRQELEDPNNIIPNDIENDISNNIIAESHAWEKADWWGTKDMWKDKVVELENSIPIEQEKILKMVQPLLAKHNMNTKLHKFMDEKLFSLEKDKKSAAIGSAYQELEQWLRGMTHGGFDKYITENKTIMQLIGAVRSMREHIDRGGPK